MSITEVRKITYTCDRCDETRVIETTDYALQPYGWIKAHEDSRTIDLCSSCVSPETKLNREAHPHHVSDETLQEAMDYELVHVNNGNALKFNPRYLLSMVRELRQLRKLVRYFYTMPSLTGPWYDILKEWEKYK